MGNIFEKRHASIRETKMQNTVKSYLESMKYQKGIRVLHNFHGGSIVYMYEASVKSLKHIRKKQITFSIKP